MATIKEPMLAAKVKPHEIGKLVFPLFAQPKIDGYRGLLLNGKFLTRKFIRWPNLHIRKVMESAAKDLGLSRAMLDGEIIVDGVGFNEGGGKLRKKDATPSFRFVVFDFVGEIGPGGVRSEAHEAYRVRTVAAEIVAEAMKRRGFPVEYIRNASVTNMAQLTSFESEVLAQGFEGVILRDPNGPHKQGRSTLREGYLTALKRFVDDEAIIEAVYEQRANTNEAGEHNTGGVKRSRKQEGLVPKGILGGVRCRWMRKPDARHPWRAGPPFRVATFKGLTVKERGEWWERREELIDKPLTVIFQEHGMDEDGRPRVPVGKYVRAEWDL